ELQAAEVTALVAQLEQRLASLNARRVRDPAAASEIPETQKAQDDARQRLQRLAEDIARLTLRADRAGIVLPPPREPRRALAGSQLPRWHGTPLDQRNRAAHLEPGTLVCLVGDPQRLDAVAVVSQADVERLQVGQHVTLRLYQQPG